MILVEPSGRGKEEEEEVGVAENGELPGFFKQAIPSFIESGLPLDGVLNPFYLPSSPPHRSLLTAPETNAPPPRQNKACHPWACIESSGHLKKPR